MSQHQQTRAFREARKTAAAANQQCHAQLEIGGVLFLCLASEGHAGPHCAHVNWAGDHVTMASVASHVAQWRGTVVRQRKELRRLNRALQRQAEQHRAERNKLVATLKSLDAQLVSAKSEARDLRRDNAWLTERRLMLEAGK